MSPRQDELPARLGGVRSEPRPIARDAVDVTPAESLSFAKRPLSGGAMVLASAVSYATLPILAKVAFRHGADSVAILAFRFAFSAPVLIMYVALRRGVAAMRRLLPAVLLPSVLYFVQTLTFFESLARMGAGLSVIVLFSYPLLVTIGGALFLGEALPRSSAAIIVAGTCGVGLSVGFSGQASAAGLAFGAVSALLFAAFFLLAKRLLSAQGADGVTFTAVVQATGGVGFPVVALVTHATGPDSASGWVAIAAIAAIGTVLATALLFSGLRHLDAGVASMISAAEPPFAVLLAAIFLSESVAATQVLGMAVVVASIAALSYVVARKTGAAEIPSGL